MSVLMVIESIILVTAYSYSADFFIHGMIIICICKKLIGLKKLNDLEVDKYI